MFTCCADFLLGAFDQIHPNLRDQLANGAAKRISEGSQKGARLFKVNLMRRLSVGYGFFCVLVEFSVLPTQGPHVDNITQF